jgi:hypothetical protein
LFQGDNKRNVIKKNEYWFNFEQQQ